MKKQLLAGVMLGALAIVTTSCSSSSGGGTGSPAAGSGAAKVIKVGFAQTGSESGWRSANTDAMKKAFSKENGFDLTLRPERLGQPFIVDDRPGGGGILQRARFCEHLPTATRCAWCPRERFLPTCSMIISIMISFETSSRSPPSPQHRWSC